MHLNILGVNSIICDVIADVVDANMKTWPLTSEVTIEH